MKKLVGEVLDRIEIFPDFDPRRNYDLTLICRNEFGCTAPVALNSTARSVLARRLQDLKTPFLFPCETDNERPVPKVNNAHDRAVKVSGVAPFRLYDLRHTWATRAAETGIDLVTLAAPDPGEYYLGLERQKYWLAACEYARPTSFDRRVLERASRCCRRSNRGKGICRNSD